MHIALLGDSTLDNARYTDGGPDVTAHLADLLVGGSRVTLLARDGATLDDVPHQLSALEPLLDRGGPAATPVTHLVLSAGGNDLLGEIDVLDRPATSVAAALLGLHERAARFGARYREVLDDVLRLRLPTVACTVYDGAFHDPTEAAVVRMALRVFDAEITEAALDRGVPVLDLRRVCDEPADYWDPIEPSERGGARIAAAILAALHAPCYDLCSRAATIQGVAAVAGRGEGS